MVCMLIKIASWVHSALFYFTDDRLKDIPILSALASWPGAKINSQWLELSMDTKISIVPNMLELLESDCKWPTYIIELQGKGMYNMTGGPSEHPD